MHPDSNNESDECYQVLNNKELIAESTNWSEGSYDDKGENDPSSESTLGQGIILQLVEDVMPAIPVSEPESHVDSSR
jgi:hypothetical protein